MASRRRLWALWAVLLGATAPLVAVASPARVVSLNLCADQMLVLLADPGVLVSVTHLAPEPSQSYVASRVTGLTLNRGRAEEVLALRPDLVVAGEYAARPAVAMLRRVGIDVIDLPIPESFDAIRAQTTLLAQRLGVEARGAGLLADMERRLAAVNRPASERRALVLGTNGFTSGQGTLVDDVLRAAGMRNIAAEDLGIIGFGRVGLEEIVRSDPEVIVVNQPAASEPSLAREFLDHPAFAAYAGRIVRIDPSLWTCGGPYTVGAVEFLAGAGR